jgi:hypothetical protein
MMRASGRCEAGKLEGKERTVFAGRVRIVKFQHCAANGLHNRTDCDTVCLKIE